MVYKDVYGCDLRTVTKFVCEKDVTLEKRNSIQMFLEKLCLEYLGVT